MFYFCLVYLSDSSQLDDDALSGHLSIILMITNRTEK